MLKCSGKGCRIEARTYIEAKKKRHGSTHWLSGYFCEDDLLLFKFNAHEQGYEITSEVPAEFGPHNV